MRNRLILVPAALFAVSACEQAQEPAMNAPAANESLAGGNQAGPAEGQAEAATAMLRVAEKQPFGPYLVDSEGRSLYLLEADTRGAGGAQPSSTCSGACAQEWPPLTTSGEPQGGPQVNGAMLSTMTRGDGASQVTYNGWPLYYYHDDQQPGDVKGQHVHDQWGEWYLVAPSGEPVEQEAS